MVSFTCSHVVCSIDDEIASINVESLAYSFEKLWVVYNALLHEPVANVLRGCSHLLYVVKLNGQLVFKLSFFAQEVCVISVVKVALVLCKWVELVVFDPAAVAIAGESLSLEFSNLAAPQKVQSSNLVMKGSPIPHTGNPEGVHEEDESVIPVPFNLKWVVDPHPEGSGNHSFIEDVGVFKVDCSMLKRVTAVQ